MVRRHRLGHVRPDADRHAGALADRRDRGSEQRLAARRRRRRRPPPSPGTRNPAGARRELDPAGAQNGTGAVNVDRGTSPWLYVAGAVVLLALLALAVLLVRRRRAGPPLPPAERAVADLVTALRRAGRPITPGMTLSELELRLGGARGSDSYLAALRAARYGGAGAPTRDQRNAFRRELAAGLGWRGQLRAWWALPPQLLR